MNLYSDVLKRVVDFTVALMALVLVSIPLLLVVVTLAIANNGKVFFIQRRPGKKGKVFRIFKFKTMNDKTDGEGNLLSDKDRLTVIGKLVRKTSLDELPQLLNVLKGDMALIGPRPLLVEYLPLYNERQRKRQDLRPGITGWAQVNGRNAISWERKFELDVWYVEHISFLLDLKILYLTVIKTLKAEGISDGDTATMERFTGTKV